MHAIFPGTFDPLTRGHLDLIIRAAKLFSHLLVAVNGGESGVKKPLFSTEERLTLLKAELQHLPNVEVCAFSGLLVDFAEDKHIMTMVRGVRNSVDCDYEMQLAHMNGQLQPNLEVIFLAAKAEYSFVRASWVKEIAVLGGDVSAFVTSRVAEALKNKILS
ncbi:MAG: pantetheine-phosphate adenylyltransferase [Gammaproteobacteria bacterium]|jgi:pantetheine-phosphate adenylyltransferase|nr:pantetheine-phosphate adenylyltransferase [Gammaproteobacteria bacterium]